MFFIINAYFRWQIRVQEWLRNNVWTRPKFFAGLTLTTAVILMFYSYIYVVKNWTSILANIVLWILLILWIVLDLIFSSEKAMTSARGFLKFGIQLVFGASIGFAAIIHYIGTLVDISSTIWLYIQFLSFSLFLGIVWLLYSSFCDSKASMFANGILTAVVSIITLTADLLTKTLLVEPTLIFLSEDLLLELEQLGFSFSQLVDAGITMLFYPILIMLGMATAVCVIKDYWTEKYWKKAACGNTTNNTD